MEQEIEHGSEESKIIGSIEGSSQESISNGVVQMTVAQQRYFRRQKLFAMARERRRFTRVVRSHDTITIDMLGGAEAITGDTRRAMMRRPEMYRFRLMLSKARDSQKELSKKRLAVSDERLGE